MNRGSGYEQRLPRLEDYRSAFTASGIALPLSKVPHRQQGLLGELPPPPPGRTGWPWSIETPPYQPSGMELQSVSIVMPSYQQGRFIEEAIRSILLQNYPNLELIVIDGGSKDRTSDVLEKYRPWLSFTRSEPDRGQAHALNIGFALAGGRVRGWLNSDDMYLPGALRRATAVAAARRADFVYGDSLTLIQESGCIRYTTSAYAHPRYLGFPGLVPSHGSFWRDGAQKAFWEEQQCAIDYELWIRMIPGLRLAYTDWPLGLVREHSAAKTHDTSRNHLWAQDAARNALAHPKLYGNGLRQRLLDAEYRVVQRLARAIRRRGIRRRADEVRKSCGWPNIDAN